MASLYLATKNVTRKKERSILTILGVLLAVGSFISLLSIAEGMYERVQRELNGRNVDVYVLPKNSLPMPLGPLAGVGQSTETIPDTIVKGLAGLSNVERAEPVYRFQQMHEGRAIVVWGLNPEAFPTFLPHIASEDGTYPKGSYDIMVGPALAREIGLAREGTLTLAGKKYIIVGIFKPVGGLQDYFCFVTPQAAAEIVAKGAQEAWLKLKEPEGRDTTAEDINVSDTLKDFRARTSAQYLGAANDFINFAWVLEFCIAAIGVLIAMTAAMNTMLMSTYERLKEFATLRAIGASRFTVVMMILTESLILSVAGGICGVVLGIMGSRLLDAAVVSLLRLSYPVASITMALLVQALLLSAFVGFVGAAIPCFIVYRMNIIMGLRQE
ncbi:MAG: ABC transporter permease [Armatimonadetes bacterium]|nr:ABC transporter permease [Armatimonadota bacterium]